MVNLQRGCGVIRLRDDGTTGPPGLKDDGTKGRKDSRRSEVTDRRPETGRRSDQLIRDGGGDWESRTKGLKG